jgi:hypothetical protein
MFYDDRNARPYWRIAAVGFKTAEDKLSDFNVVGFNNIHKGLPIQSGTARQKSRKDYGRIRHYP